MCVPSTNLSLKASNQNTGPSFRCPWSVSTPVGQQGPTDTRPHVMELCASLSCLPPSAASPRTQALPSGGTVALAEAHWPPFSSSSCPRAPSRALLPLLPHPLLRFPQPGRQAAPPLSQLLQKPGEAAPSTCGPLRTWWLRGTRKRSSSESCCGRSREPSR